MSVCEDIKERLCEFLDGELAQSDRAVVESHLQSCAACREELGTLREAASAVHKLERRPAPASILAGVRSGLKTQPQTPEAPREVVRPEHSFWVRRALSVAAVLIVAALIYVAYVPQEREQRAQAPASPGSRSAAKTAMPEAARSARDDAPAASPVFEATPSIATDEVTDARDAKSQAFPKAKSPDRSLGKLRSSEDAAEVRAKSSIRAEGEKQATTPFDDTETNATQQPQIAPNAPAPVAQGTPPHVAEGVRKPLSKEAVVQQLKDGFNELTQTRESKSDAGIATKRKEEEEANQGKLAEAGKPNDIARPVTPAATAVPQEPGVEVAQVEKTGQAIEQKELDVAQDWQRDDELRLKSQASAPAKALAGGTAKGNEKPTAGFAGSTPQQQLGVVDGASLEGMVGTGGKPGRQVLTVPVKDLAVVVEDLRRMAAASGGDLAWQPSLERRRAQKKEPQQQAQQEKELLGVEQAVMHVPPARMAELLRATEQYRAQLLLSMEAAKADQNARYAATVQQAAKDSDRSVEYIQVVLDIQPQAVAAASEAVRTERGTAEESEKTNARQ